MKLSPLFPLAALLGCVALAACTRPNPDACCTNEAECLALGVDELRPCSGGRVCSNNTCFAAQCDTATECSASAPYCSNRLCVDACRVEGDCVGVPGAPLCADDGVCVGCRNNTDCSGDAPICDPETRSCRGCEADSDCASGICLEADGACATDEETVFVNSGNGTDQGDCPRSHPCSTLAYAFAKAVAPRTVIRLDGGAVGTTTTLDPGVGEVTIDAALSVSLTLAPSNGTIFSVGGGGHLTISGLRFTAGGKLSALQAGSIRLSHVVASDGQATFGSAEGGQLRVDSSIIARPISCSNNGSVTVMRSRIGNPAIISVISLVNCDSYLSRNYVVASSGALAIEGGKGVVENNVFVTPLALADLLEMRQAGAGSRFQFNTAVNTSNKVDSGVAMFCDASANAAYNIFAYGSTAPHSGGCPTRYSLYDSAAGFVNGEGNVVADSTGFFVDPAREDFRPSATSPARGMADDGAMIREDFNGGVRPLPAGTRADVGAFEVP